MDEQLIGRIVTLYDEEDNEIELIVLDAMEHKGVCYLALEQPETDDQPAVRMLMKHPPQDPEALMLVDPFDDEEEFDEVDQIFFRRMDRD